MVIRIVLDASVLVSGTILDARAGGNPARASKPEP
jgi:hypothetical protein